MLYQIKITSSVNEIGQKFSPIIKKAAKAALKELAENPNLGKELQEELSGFRSYRFMRYRIIYKVDALEKIIIIWAIGHRRDIYENFSDLLLRSESK
ncbi:MAG: type II toxin-antitoxin system RelE/ParE family toxin [Bacteroidetes bacterium]|nr:type II toxin-antitoxin system RelE/ParE family toxin [Bacteroidota bacterium]